VVVQRGIGGGAGLSRPVAPVDEQKVLRAVAVRIKECAAVAERFWKVFLAERSARVTGVDPGSCSRVSELRQRRGGLLRVRGDDENTCSERSQNGSSEHQPSFSGYRRGSELVSEKWPGSSRSYARGSAAVHCCRR